MILSYGLSLSGVGEQLLEHFKTISVLKTDYVVISRKINN